jgi:molybdate transport system substrate-binding protein
MNTLINSLSIFIVVLCLASCKNKGKQNTELLFYCAAGLKTPIEEIVNQYEKEYGITVTVQYGGSGTLLSNLRISKRGDLYLATDDNFLEIADSYNLLDETQVLAFQKPVILVSNKNPKNITSIHDFLRDDVSYCIGTPEATSIGRITKEVFDKSGLWEKIESKAMVFKPTVYDVANDVKLGIVDAGIVWDAVARQYPKLEIVEDTTLNNYVEAVSVSILKSSNNPTEALRFIRYLSAKDKGLAVFRKYNYQIIEGDKWAVKPEIVFFSGAVNRMAIEETINKFELREGVTVNRIYNGCGILVGQIKLGQQPDAFLSCDLSFMDQVNKGFSNIINVSETDIVIATKKGNPLQIQSLSDLKNKSLKIGVANHEQSALGALTQQLFKELNFEDINKNVVVQAPTADLLINQLRTGSLDAVIVYLANTAQVRDKIDVVKINEKKASAIQNLGLSIQSENINLMKRFINALKSEDSGMNYIENGFVLRD